MSTFKLDKSEGLLAREIRLDPDQLHASSEIWMGTDYHIYA